MRRARVCVWVWVWLEAQRDWEHNKPRTEQNKGADKLLAVNVWSTAPCHVATNPHILSVICEKQVTALQVKGWLTVLHNTRSISNKQVKPKQQN